MAVSIHAPARGATLPLVLLSTPLIVSIHAPARGATAHDAVYRRCRTVSIHAPARGATINYFDNPQTRTVSIHAPARGATNIAQNLMPFFLFQSTLPRGERQIGQHFGLFSSGFQSTLPRGERRAEKTRLPHGSRFNPRSRAGSDHYVAPFGKLPDVSIHAPARGATFRVIQCQNRARVSIHAPARGATIITGLFDVAFAFQSTLPRGERPL